MSDVSGDKRRRRNSRCRTTLLIGLSQLTLISIQDMGPKKSTSSSSLSSHSARAAAILASARKAANSPSKTTKPPAKSSSSSSNESSSQSDPSLDSPISLQSLMSHISTSTQLSMRDAMALSAKLIKSKRNTVNKLTKLSPFALEESGIDPKSDNGKKVLAAFRGKKAAGLKQVSTRRRRGG